MSNSLKFPEGHKSVKKPEKMKRNFQDMLKIQSCWSVNMERGDGRQIERNLKDLRAKT